MSETTFFELEGVKGESTATQGKDKIEVLSAAGINYGMLRQQEALKRLKEIETIKPN